MSKKKYIIIKLISTANTGHFYTIKKKKNYKLNNIKYIKYDPIIKYNVIYKEIKLK